MRVQSISLLYFLLLFASCVSVNKILRLRTAENSEATNTPTTLRTVSVFGNSVQREIAPRTWDLLHCELQVSFNWGKHECNGKQKIWLKPYFYSQDSIVLDAKSMKFSRIELFDQNGNDILFSSTYNNRQLRLQLERKFTATDSLRMEIEYVASPDLVEAVKGKAIRDEKGLYFINTDHAEPFLPVQLWTQGETESTSCWFPCIDRPDEKFTMKLSITVNKELQTLSNGKRIASEVQGNLRTDTWVSAQPMSAYLYMMAAGEFRVQTDSLTEPALDTIFFTRYDTLRPACTDDAGTEAAWVKEVPMFRVVNAQRDMLNGVGVSYYLEPEYAPFAKAIFKGTPEMIDFFSAKLGVPYPWDKYAQIVVRDYVSGAMENTSATLHGESVQKTPRELLDASNDDIIAHELFHQWFGDLVTCKSWSQLVLNEGFASFGEQLWIEYRYGEDAALVKRMQAINRYLGYSERVSDEAIVRYNYRHPDDMFTTITYQKGARVLQLLRQTLGDDAFFQGLKNYLTRFAFQAADLDDLRKEMEAVSGLDLKLFFRQWFETGGHPMLDIRYEFNDSTHRMAVVVEQKQSTETVYRFPLQFKVHQNNQSKLYTFDIQHRKEVFYVNQTDTSAFEMPNVTVDPYACFPGEINDHKSFVQHIQTYFGKGTIVEKVRALEAIKDMQKGNDTIQKVLLIALSDRKPFLRQKALEWISWKEKQVDSSLAQGMADMALGDSSQAVKNKATEVLAMLTRPEQLNTLITLVHDSSYRTAAFALDGIYRIQPETALHFCRKLESQARKELLAKIISIYSSDGELRDTAFFFQNLMRCRPGYRVELMAGMTTLVIRLQDTVLRNRWIAQMADRSEQDHYSNVKFNAILQLKAIQEEMDKQVFQTKDPVEKQRKEEEARTLKAKIQWLVDRLQDKDCLDMLHQKGIWQSDEMPADQQGKTKP